MYARIRSRRRRADLRVTKLEFLDENMRPQATGDGARKCRHVLYFLRPSTPSIDAGSSRPVIASPTPINTSLERQTQPKPEAGKFTTLITLHVRGNPLTESYDSPPTILGISSPEPRIRTIDENKHKSSIGYGPVPTPIQE
ncbi:hypothetical protein CISG_04502 [Coccidioides immitis RMSCC 3703]|uniref:Uncharacterized protein n=2 Tax=Coccidioides immitis TaxID=5501 RepID=A0A0J8QPR5_COCIT|nr:hypothetical protein CIRG_05379 [Coccidioides immitis RMSCC 2394]KMU74431.1 hypothetical protein CISG_04502 [Coccidioides immitis RMSCC 3703]